MSYGVDVWCGDVIVPGRLARGRAVVLLALYRRLITPRGMLRGGDEESAYGFDVSSYIGAVGAETALQALPALVRGELLKDDRVADVAVTVARDDRADGTIALAIEVTGVLADEGDEFALTLSADATSLALLGGVE